MRGMDAVNFSDPFGLCPEKLQDDEEKCREWNQAIVGRRIAEINKKSRVRFLGVALTEATGTVGGTFGTGMYCNDEGCGAYLTAGPAKGNTQSAAVVVGTSTNRSAFTDFSRGGCANLGPVGGCVTNNPSGTTESVSLTHPAIGPKIGGHIEVPGTMATKPSPLLRAIVRAACATSPAPNPLCGLP